MRLFVGVVLLWAVCAQAQGINCGYNRQVLADYLAQCRAIDGCAQQSRMQQYVDQECGTRESGGVPSRPPVVVTPTPESVPELTRPRPTRARSDDEQTCRRMRAYRDGELLRDVTHAVEQWKGAEEARRYMKELRDEAHAAQRNGTLAGSAAAILQTIKLQVTLAANLVQIDPATGAAVKVGTSSLKVVLKRLETGRRIGEIATDPDRAFQRIMVNEMTRHVPYVGPAIKAVYDLAADAQQLIRIVNDTHAFYSEFESRAGQFDREIAKYGDRGVKAGATAEMIETLRQAITARCPDRPRLP